MKAVLIFYSMYNLGQVGWIVRPLVSVEGNSLMFSYILVSWEEQLSEIPDPDEEFQCGSQRGLFLLSSQLQGEGPRIRTTVATMVFQCALHSVLIIGT